MDTLLAGAGRGLAAFVCFGALAGCTTFDPINHQVETINTDATAYGYNATLLNVVHAERREPLTFVNISGLDGTDTIQGTLGIPSIVFGPHPSTSPRDFTIGSNSIQRTGSNVFHVTVVSDPASFAALLAPINPAQIAFFKAQGFDNSLLFYLLVDRIRQVNEKGATIQQWVNDPDLDHWYNSNGKPVENVPPGPKPAGWRNPFGEFVGQLGTLLDEGLNAQADVTVEPTGRSLPPSRLCLDPFIRPAFNPQSQPLYKNLCSAGAGWIESTAAKSGGDSGSGSSASPISVTTDGSLWIVRADKAIRFDKDGTTHSYDIPKLPDKPYQQPRVAYELEGQNGEHFQISTRSVYGAYNYLGAFLRNGDNLERLFALPGKLIEVEHSERDCFAEIDYKSQHYCAPDSASNTKVVFGLLQLLQELDTAAPPTPATLTVHDVP